MFEKIGLACQKTNNTRWGLLSPNMPDTLENAVNSDGYNDIYFIIIVVK